MRWALNQITLRGGSRRGPEDLAADLAAVRAGGWRDVELWLPHWDSTLARQGLGGARRLLDDAGLTAAGGCGPLGDGSLFFSHGEEQRLVHATLAQRLEQCQALGAGHLVVAPGLRLPARPEPGDLDRAGDSVRTAAETGTRFGIRLGIEFLAGARLLSTLSTAVDLAGRVAHPNVGIVLDTYHLYAGPSKVEDLDLLVGAGPPGGTPGGTPGGPRDPSRTSSRLFFVHVSDVESGTPRELWRVSDRTLPGAGGIPNRAILDRVRAQAGAVSLELFSPRFEAAWEADPVAAARTAYARCTALEPDR